MAQNKIIISLSGFKGSGKDTAAHLLKQHADFASISFAAPLKKAVSEMFGWPPELLEGHTAESRLWREQPDSYWSTALKRKITPRLVLQEFGTDVVRAHISDDFWILAAHKAITACDRHVVITDARFPNELDMIKRLGGICVRIKRGPEPWWYDLSHSINCQPAWIKTVRTQLNPKLKQVHASEREWIGYNFDQTLVNDSNLEDLDLQIQALLRTCAVKTQ